MAYGRGKKGKHYGSLAGGFINGLLTSLRYNMLAKHYEAQEKYWDYLEKQRQGAGVPPQEVYSKPARDWKPGEPGAGKGVDPNASEFEKFKAAMIGEEGAGYGTVNKIGATGKYQVMPNNIGPWTKQYVGKEMTQEEFRNDPAAQDKVFEGVTKDRYRQYGDWHDVAALWHSGLDYSDAVAAHRHDSNETTADYVNHVINKAGLQDAKPRSETAFTAPATTTKAADANNAPLKDPALADKKPEAIQAVTTALNDAKSMLGKNEVPNRQEIMDYLHNGGQNLDPHQSAWCASFVSASLQKAGLPIPTTVVPGSAFGPGAYAPNYKTWGTGVDPKDIRAGDVVVANSGGHVGFAEGPPRMGPNGLEVQLIAGNEKDPSGKYTPGSYTSPTGEVARRSQVGQVGERWVPLSQYTGRRYDPTSVTSTAAQPAVAAPAAKPAPAPPPPPAVAAKPVAPPSPRQPAPPVAKPPTPPPPSTAVAEAQPIAPAIPAAAAAPVDVSEPEAARPLPQAGYGPNGKWGPNPPLAHRPDAPDQPGQPPPDQSQVALASNPPGAIPPAPGDDGGMDMVPDMSQDVDASAGTGMDMVPAGMGMMAKRGGVVRRYWRGGAVRGYQGGGDIQDPGGSSIGMPPGLAGGGQQTPPIYFNPATYAAAGAPVGKGISATSAPTFTAGAIPTLPMARGGVVTGFQDGGDVEEAMPDTSYQDMAITQDLERQGGPGAAQADPMAGIKQYSWDDTTPVTPEQRGPQLASAGGGGFGLRMPSFSTGTRMSMPRGPSGMPRGTGGGGKDPGYQPDYGASTAPADDTSHPDHPANNPDLPPHTPQVMDQDGNPSHGLISAIADGLHYLGTALGIAPGQKHGAIANDPDTQANRRTLVDGGTPGVETFTPEHKKELDSIVDPHNTLDGNLRNIAGLEGVYEWYRDKGDMVNASKMAAAIMNASVQTSMKFGDEAVQRYYKGDLQGSIDALNLAKQQITDGTMIGARISDDGKSVEVSGHKLNGEELWREVVAPQAVLSAALHAKNGSMAWNFYERTAGKYSPDYADKLETKKFHERQDLATQSQTAAENRAEETYKRHRQDEEDKEARKKAAAEEESGRTLEVLKGMEPDTAPATTAPATAPAPVTPAGQPTSTPRGAGQQAAIPPGPQAAPDLTQTASLEPMVPSTSTPVTAPVDTTGTAVTAPKPADADVAGRPPAQAIPPGPQVAAAGATPTAQPAAVTPTESPAYADLENSRLSNLQRIRTEYGYNDQTKSFADAPPIYKKPETVPGYANLTTADKIAAHRAYQDSINANRAWTQNRMAQMKQEEIAVNSDIGRRFSALKDQEKERFSQQQQTQREGVKAALDRTNKLFASNIAGSAPRKPEDMDRHVGEGKTFDPYIEMARAFNPKLDANASRDDAKIDLGKQNPLFADLNTQKVLASAYEEGVRHSTNTHPDVVSSAIQRIATGTQAIVSPEAVDEKGNPIEVHGVVRYDVTTTDASGNHVSMRLPKDDLDRLKAIGERYRKAETAAKSKVYEGRVHPMEKAGAGYKEPSPTMGLGMPGEMALPGTTRYPDILSPTAPRGTRSAPAPAIPAQGTRFDENPPEETAGEAAAPPPSSVPRRGIPVNPDIPIPWGTT